METTDSTRLATDSQENIFLPPPQSNSSIYRNQET